MTAFILKLIAVISMLIDGVMTGVFLGDDCLAAYGLTSPVNMLLVALGGLLASGAQVLGGRCVGKQDQEGLNKVLTTSVTTGFAGFSGDELLSAAYFEKIFKEAIDVAEERNVALYCGEYGVIDRVAPEDALKWYKMINQVFKANGIGRSAWNYKKMDFGISDDRMDAVRDELVQYL